MKTLKKFVCVAVCIAFLVSCVIVPLPASASGVASVGSTEYPTLAAAVAAAGTGDTVLLLADTSVDSAIRITKNIILNSDGNCTVSRSAGYTTGPVFSVEAGGTLTVAGKTALNGASVSASNAFINVSGGTLTIRDGVTVSSCAAGAVRLSSGVCSLNGGSFSGNNVAVYVESGASGFRISGGVSFGGTDSIQLASGKYIEINGALTGSGSITVAPAVQSAGTRIARLADSLTLSEAQLGRFAVETSSGYKRAVLSGSSVNIGEASADITVARVNGSSYGSLADAVASVGQGASATVELCADTVVSGEINIGSRSITIVGDGAHTITRSASFKVGSLFSVNAGASLSIGTQGDPVTVSGGSVSATMPAIYCGGEVTLGAAAAVTSNINTNPNAFYQGIVFIPEGGVFNLAGGHITANNPLTGTVLVYGGTFNMSGGEISGNRADNGAGVYISSGAFNMSGGSVYSNAATASGGAVYCSGVLRLSGNASIPGNAALDNDVYLPSGRTITVDAAWKPASGKVAVTPADTAEGTKLAVCGTNSPLSADSFALTGALAAAHKPRAAENYIFIGPLGDDAYVAYIGNTPYKSLAEAVAAVQPNGAAVTVSIVADVPVREGIAVTEGKNIILSTAPDPLTGADYTARTLKRDAAFDGAFFTVAANARLELAPAADKQLILDGSGADALNSVIVVNGTLDMNERAVIRGNSLRKNENLSAAEPAFGSGGAVLVGATGVFNMKGGTLESNYAARGGAVFIYDGVFNFTGGNISNNSALYGGGVMIFNTVTADNVTPPAAAAQNTQNNTQNAQTPAEHHGYMSMTGGTLNANTAAANTALKYANGQGGAVYIGNAATLEMSGGAITGNKAGAGAGIYAGTLRAKDEKPLRIPVLKLSGAAAFAKEDDVYLALVNDSVITVTGALSSVTKNSPVTVSIPDLLSQNSSLVLFAVTSYSQEQNELAAKNAADNRIFVLSEAAAGYYTIGQSTANGAMLLNTTDDEASLCYAGGRYYNGLPLYEEDREKAADDSDTTDTAETTAADTTDTASKEEKPKTPIKYEPIAINADGCFTACFTMSYYANLYKNLHTQLVGALPAGTKLTLVDTSNAEKPAYYYYEVTGKENVRADTQAAESTDKDAKKPVSVLEIPLESFLAMGQDKLHFGEFTEEDKPSTDAKAKTLDRLVVVVDFSQAEIAEDTLFSGQYTLAWEHNYPGEAEGSFHNISENFAAVQYTVGALAASTVTLGSGENGISVTYKLAQPSRVIDADNGILLLEQANGEFPAGTVITCDGKQYPVSDNSGKIAVTLPRGGNGAVETEGSMLLEISNYYGAAILNTKIRGVIYASFDGRHASAGAEFDAASEAVAYTLDAKESWSVSVTGADGLKPVYEFSSAASAESLLMTVKAMRNTDDASTVTLTLQNGADDYAEIPLSTLFIGYDTADSEGVEIPVGACTMKLREDAPNGEYRMAFTAGDKVEHIKIKLGK